MNRILIFLLPILACVMLGACTDKEDEPVLEEQPEVEKTSNSTVTYISYQEAVEAGYLCYDSSHYNDSIYPTRVLNIVLPRNGDEVVVDLLSMASIRMDTFTDSFGFQSAYKIAKVKGDYYLRCSDAECYIFRPVEIETGHGLTVIQSEPTKIIFKPEANYKYPLNKHCFRVYRNRVIPIFDPRRPPCLYIFLTFEH